MVVDRKPKLVTGRFSTMHADYLDELVKKGYGTDRVEVVEYLVHRALDDLLRGGVLRQ